MQTFRTSSLPVTCMFRAHARLIGPACGLSISCSDSHHTDIFDDSWLLDNCVEPACRRFFVSFVAILALILAAMDISSSRKRPVPGDLASRGIVVQEVVETLEILPHCPVGQVSVIFPCPNWKFTCLVLVGRIFCSYIDISVKAGLNFTCPVEQMGGGDFSSRKGTFSCPGQSDNP